MKRHNNHGNDLGKELKSGSTNSVQVILVIYETGFRQPIDLK